MADGGIMEAALMSAAIGGGTSLATGQDPLKGALLGAITGGATAGVGGLLGTPAAAGTTEATDLIKNAIGNPTQDIVDSGILGSQATLSPSVANVMNGVGGTSAANAGITSGLDNAVSSNLYPNYAPSLNTVSNVADAANTTADTVAQIPSKLAAQSLPTPPANLSNGIRSLAGINPGDTGYLAKGLNYYDTLSPLEKGIGGVGVGYGYGALTKKPNTVPMLPKYNSKLAGYNRDEFTPTDPTQPNPYYTAQYAAQGGLMQAYAGGGAIAFDQGGIAAMAGQQTPQGPQGAMYPQSQQVNTQYATPSQMPTSSEIVNSGYEATTNPYTGEPVGFAQGGGIGSLGGYAHGGNPQLLDGPGDGMSDSIPASIGNKQPARLAQGEFVVPADVVSHLGNGSTDAGAKHLYNMMDQVRKARTGNSKQGKQINPAKYLA